MAKSMKQKIVCRSSTESELVALSNATSLVAYELQFMMSLGFQMGHAQVYQDNTSTIRMAHNGKSCSDRTKTYKIEVFLYKAISRFRGVSGNTLPYRDNDGRYTHETITRKIIQRYERQIIRLHLSEIISFLIFNFSVVVLELKLGSALMTVNKVHSPPVDSFNSYARGALRE